MAYWPDSVALEESDEAFIEAFQTLGYEVCDSAELEEGVQKVALYKTGKPTHAARQLTNGKWTSKLGESEDIWHELEDLEGRVYGEVFVILARQRPR